MRVAAVLLAMLLAGCAGEYIDNRGCNGPLPTLYKCK